MTLCARWVFDALNCQQVISKLFPSDQICFFLLCCRTKTNYKKKIKRIIQGNPWHNLSLPMALTLINDVTSTLVNPCKISQDSNAGWALSLHNGKRCFRLNYFYASICMSIYMPLLWYLITICIVKNLRGKSLCFIGF